jgi:glucose/arabinose dehydrogenase
MKQTIAIFALLGAGVVAAQTSDTTQVKPAQAKPAPAVTQKNRTKKSQTKTTVAKKPAAPVVAQPLTVPPDAVANADGSYSYTDRAGRKWTYNKTPFGVSRIEDMGNDPSAFATIPKEQLIKATDNGETVKFQRQTPFGTTNWEKKKSELTDEERHIFESQQPKPE